MTDPEFAPKSSFCPFHNMTHPQFAQNPKGKRNPEFAPNCCFGPSTKWWIRNSLPNRYFVRLTKWKICNFHKTQKERWIQNSLPIRCFVPSTEWQIQNSLPNRHLVLLVSQVPLKATTVVNKAKQSEKFSLPFFKWWIRSFFRIHHLAPSKKAQKTQQN